MDIYFVWAQSYFTFEVQDKGNISAFGIRFMKVLIYFSVSWVHLYGLDVSFKHKTFVKGHVILMTALH